MSVVMTRERITMPPPPTPCMHLPMRSTVMLFAMLQRTEPMVKTVRLDNSTQVRPKTSLKAARKGMVVALARRYEVPTQNAWVAVIDRAVVIRKSVVITMVASRDIISETMERVIRIATSWAEGFQRVVEEEVCCISWSFEDSLLSDESFRECFVRILKLRT
jgi:hypothetical protein